MYELTVVIPTYNEHANIRPMFALLDKALKGHAWEVVYVDDDSPDGTADEVRALSTEQPNVRVLHRIGRRGLSGACIEGILSSVSPNVAVIDCDMQHDETKLADMLAAMQSDPELDLVVGSRHVEGGSATGGFTAVRAWGSDVATSLTKRLLRISISDPMSGFFMVRREAFSGVVDGLQQQGFKILADMVAAARGSWKIKEVGYEFRDRQFGESKMDSAVVFDFLGLLVSRLSGGLLPLRFILFMFVGLTGLFVQLAVVRLALFVNGGEFLWAQSFGVFVAMTSNFVLNNMFTYRDRILKGRAFWTGLLSFYGVCFIGAVANVAVAELIYQLLPSWAIASIAGAVMGALWNFGASSIVTWKSKID